MAPALPSSPLPLLASSLSSLHLLHASFSGFPSNNVFSFLSPHKLTISPPLISLSVPL